MGVQAKQIVAADISSETNPFVGPMASRLVKTFAADFPGGDADRWALITEMLGFAAEAEQQIAEQRDRISQLESLAMTDELTGVGNRRGLEDFLRRALANAERHGETGVVAFLDLDGFKQINDRFGHAVGDECLRTAARLLTANTRIGDYVARPGGDEFVVILTHCNATNGRARMRHLQRLLDGAVVHHQGEVIALKTSLGSVPYRNGTTSAGLLRAADSEMYRNKLIRVSAAAPGQGSAAPKTVTRLREARLVSAGRSAG